MKRVAIIILFVYCGSFCFLPSVHAATSDLFYDNFESDLSKWVWGNHIHSGVIEAEAGNHYLVFGEVTRGGDIFSSLISNPTGQYSLSFDYKGDPTMGGTPDELGGFVGYVEDGNGLVYDWLAGTREGYIASGRTVEHLTDTGEWNHYNINFIAPANIRLVLEDWRSEFTINNIPRDAMFDNIRVTAAPEPTSMALFALGGGAMALWRRRRKKYEH